MDFDDESTWPTDGDYGPIVRSCDLKPGDVPTGDYSWMDFVDFASKVDGYAIGGSDAVAARALKSGKHIATKGPSGLSTTDLRLWAFFEWRAQRHGGAEEIDDQIRSVLGEIRDRVIS